MSIVFLLVCVGAVSSKACTGLTTKTAECKLQGCEQKTEANSDGSFDCTELLDIMDNILRVAKDYSKMSNDNTNMRTLDNGSITENTTINSHNTNANNTNNTVNSTTYYVKSSTLLIAYLTMAISLLD